MDAARTKALETIEQRMQGLEEGSLRYHVLECSKNFKTSWIELGRSLYSVFKDKSYKEWGFSNFDIYCAKEIGIRKQTAMKLLRSYYFLEKEEPQYLKQDFIEAKDASSVPSYESIDLLRRAKNKKTLDAQDYSELKSKIFEKGKDAREVKKDLTQMIRQREELEPEEAREKKKFSAVKRFISTLKALKRELEIAKLLPSPLIKEAESLIRKLEDQIS